MKRSSQLSLLKNTNKAHGGILRNTRKGRQGPRPLATKQSMHLVLRSKQAQGKWSFLHGANDRKVGTIVAKFANKYGVRILKVANVGNHLHLHIQLSKIHLYKPFIRAITASIAMAITGISRWKKGSGKKFWDYRPFTRVVMSFRAFLTLNDYIEINRWEGFGFQRNAARSIHEINTKGWSSA